LRIFGIVPLVLFLSLGGSFAGRPVRAQGERKHTQRLLAPFPPEVYATTVLSPDGRRIAYIKPGGAGATAVIDGKPEKTYEEVAGLVFSPNSRWHAYAARAGGAWRIVVNGREQPPHGRVGEPAFSPDSSRLAYVALQADGERVAVVEINQPPGKSFDRIFEGEVVFSPDSRRLAYGVRLGDKWFAVVDGKEIGPFDFLGSTTGFRFSPDSGHFAFGAMIGKQWCAVVDGKNQKLYDNVGALAFSPDAKLMAYVASAAGKWFVVHGDCPNFRRLDRENGTVPLGPDKWQEGPAHDAIGEETLRFSPDGRRLAYAAVDGGRWRPVVDGRPGKACDGIAEMKFSPDGRSFAYVARSGETEMVVLDGREQNAYDRIGGGTLEFSPDGRRLGYIARSGRVSFAVVDTRRQPRHDMVGYLTFAPDGKHFVYAAIDGDKTYTVVDDSPSSHHYTALWTAPDARLLFDARGAFHYLAVKEGNMYLVEEAQ
jgi:Tol biopolymer transport system component